MKTKRDEGNEVKVITYKGHEIVVNEYPDDDYPDYKYFYIDIFKDEDMVYEGEECLDHLYEAINLGKKFIDEYEDNEEPVSNWHDYYGVKEREYR